MPAAPEALLAKAEELVETGRPRVAARLLAALATTGHAPVAVAIAGARAALAQDAPAAALDLLAGVAAEIRVLPGTAAAWFWHVHARALQAAGENSAACRSAARAASLHPSAETVGLHATLLMQSGRIAQAAILLGDAIAAGTQGAGLHAALAVALLQLGESAAARAAVTRGLHIHPGDPGLRHLGDVAAAA